MVGNFVQVGPDGRRVDGTFSIQKPGKVRFQYNPPSPIDIIADGSSVVVRDRSLETADLLSAVADAAALSARRPHRSSARHRRDQRFADDTFVTVVIEETQIMTGTNRLMMMFDAKNTAAQAVDRHRSAGARHHGRGLQSGLGEKARPESVRHQLHEIARLTA